MDRPRAGRRAVCGRIWGEIMPTLNWLSREEDLVAASKVPYRLLEEVPELCCKWTERGNV